MSDAVNRAQDVAFGNPNSQHALGRAAAAAIERARGEVALLVGAEADDVRFTGSATEALRLALSFALEDAGGRTLRVLSTPIEHPALMSALAELERSGLARVKWLTVDQSARIDLEQLAGRLPDADLLCLMAVNNEVGTIQPFEEAAALASSCGVRCLIDATQGAGRIALDAQCEGIDYLVFAAHKIYGPKGVGALVGAGLSRRPSPPGWPGHEPTPNTPAIVGFGEAARLRRLERATDEGRIASLRDRLQARLMAGVDGLTVNGGTAHRVAGNLHISVPGIQNDVVTAQLDGVVAISTGAACVSGVDQPSHVLRAMGLEPWRQEGALRISLGKFTTEEEVDRAAEAIITAVRDVRTLLETGA